MRPPIAVDLTKPLKHSYASVALPPRCSPTASRARGPGLERSRAGNPFELPVLVAALLVIPVIAIEESAAGDQWRSAAAVVNWMIWLVFAAELVTLLGRRSRPIVDDEPSGAGHSLGTSLVSGV